MLLNEFLKEHAKVEAEQSTIAELKSTVTKQAATSIEQQKSFESKLAKQEKRNRCIASRSRKVRAQLAGERNACYIKSIFGQVVVTGLPVLIDSNNKLGTNVSSKRFKENIKPMDKASEAILALKPVTFHYKSDKSNTPQFGLIAEDVAAASPELVVRDKDGKPYAVRYEQVNAMLLNEFLKRDITHFFKSAARCGSKELLSQI